MIRFENLHKRFRGRPALNGISFSVERGEIFGLLGHNGAGKSTTLGIALGHLHADEGRVTICGHDVATHRREALGRVGAIYEAPAFYDYLSGRKNLEFFVSLSGHVERARMDEVVGLVGLEKRIGDRVRTYSHGMRQRLALAQALLPDPEWIFLDEPTEGLDPAGIHEMRDLVRHLRDACGLTVVLCSHLLHEVEQLCDRVAILHQGSLVFCGEWRDAAERAPRWRVEADDPLACSTLLREMGAGIGAEADVFLFPPEWDAPEILATLVGRGMRVRGFSRIRPCLEDFYLEKSKQ